MTRALALAAALAAGCLGEPDRPHGLGVPIAAGSVLRPRSVVADLNDDGYDDLAIWGNESAPGTNPTLFVYFGGEILENPDVRVDLTLVDPGRTAQWYETVEAAAYISADGRERGFAILSAQDTTPRATPPGTIDRRFYASYAQVKGRTVGALQHSHGLQRGTDNYAPDNTGLFIVERDTVSAPPATELIWGDSDDYAYPGPLVDGSNSQDLRLALGPPPYISNAFTLPGGQDLLLLGEGKVARTTGDPGALGADTFLTFGCRPGLTLKNGGFGRAHGRQEGSHFFAVMDNDRDARLSVFDVDGGSDPVGLQFLATSQVDDTSIAQLGGDAGKIDVAAIQDGSLGVYLDVGEGTSQVPMLPTPTHIGSPDVLAGYDLLAVGNFHGDGRREIYAINTADPSQGIRCYRVSGDALDRCNGE